jgi:acetyl esterase/lipase
MATANRSRPASSEPANALRKRWLEAPRIALWPGDPPGADGFVPQALPADWPSVFIRNVAKPEMRVFRPARPNGTALLVVPGGSYRFVSFVNEGLDVAERMLAYGVTVCVLTYRLPGEGWRNRSDVPLQDAQRAVRVMRSHARQLGFAANAVSVLGFSAGGHLAATLATQHSETTYPAVDATDELDPRPRAAGLIYPVISMEKPLTHAESRMLLLGDSPTDEQVAHRCPERHVDPTTPPAFLVHAFDDPAVPVDNSLRFMNAMRTAQRPVEAHLLQEGGHAFGVGAADTLAGSWIEMFSKWLQRLA